MDTTTEKQRYLPSSWVVRECGALVGNWFTFLASFALGWLVTRHADPSLIGEAVEDLFLTCLHYLPVAFTMIYLPLRFAGIIGRSSTSRVSRILASPWALGIVVGFPLALADSYAHVLSVLDPLLRFVGV